MLSQVIGFSEYPEYAPEEERDRERRIKPRLSETPPPPSFSLVYFHVSSDARDADDDYSTLRARQSDSRVPPLDTFAPASAVYYSGATLFFSLFLLSCSSASTSARFGG